MRGFDLADVYQCGVHEMPDMEPQQPNRSLYRGVGWAIAVAVSAFVWAPLIWLVIR